MRPPSCSHLPHPVAPPAPRVRVRLRERLPLGEINAFGHLSVMQRAHAALGGLQVPFEAWFLPAQPDLALLLLLAQEPDRAQHSSKQPNW